MKTLEVEQSRGSHSASDSSAPARDLGPSGTASDGSAEPTSGSAPDARVVVPDVTERVRDVLSALDQQPKRDAAGHFVKDGLAAGTTLQRSERFWSAVEPAKRDLVELVQTDVAVDNSTAETLRGLIDAYAEARLFRTSMFLRLVDLGGPITPKGKSRALYAAYLSALDRETKLAQVIGLQRRAKPVATLNEIMRSEEGADGK